MMVGFIKASCIEAIRDHLDPGEHMVGTHVNLSHVAATPPGMMVRTTVELVVIEGRLLTLRVGAFDEAGSIGEGTHQRAVIDATRFSAKAREKARQFGLNAVAETE